MSEEITYPVESSLRGDNTEYVKCEFRARQQNYAICLNTLKAFNEGRRKEGDVCCSEIKKKICPALKMREEELAAGHTLYYTPRVKVEVAPVVARTYETPQSVKRTDSYQRGYSSAGDVIRGKPDKLTPVSAKRAPAASVAKKSEIFDGDMASVVSQMAKDHAAGIVEEKKVVVVKPSESLVDKTRRLREERGL